MKKARIVDGMRYGALGVEFATIIVVAVILGYHLDGYLGTSPLFMMLLIVGGFSGALKRLISSLKRTTQNR